MNRVPPQRLALMGILALRALALVALSGPMWRIPSVTMLQMLELSSAMMTVSSYQDRRRVDLPQLAWLVVRS